MKISIVIPTYNEEKYIGRTLESIKQLDNKDYQVEILVIDSYSKDKTADVARSYDARVVSVAHRGIGYARQKGVEYARGEIVAYTDADTILPKDWLVRHIRALSGPGVVFSFGPFKVMDGDFPYYHFINYIQFYGWILFYKFIPPLAAGQNIAFIKDKALLIGGVNTHLQLMEDNDLAMRMSKIGKVIFLPDLVVYSSGRRSHEGWKFFSRTLKAIVHYFFLGDRTLEVFPDFR